MADPQNPGQFGNRKDMREQAKKGGEASPSQFGMQQGADPQKAGEMGAKAQPTEAKREGGEHSHRSS